MEATTGSGKTLAFGIPVFEILKRVYTLAESSSSVSSIHDVGALVIAPTRLVIK